MKNSKIFIPNPHCLPSPQSLLKKFWIRVSDIRTFWLVTKKKKKHPTKVSPKDIMKSDDNYVFNSFHDNPG